MDHLIADIDEIGARVWGESDVAQRYRERLIELQARHNESWGELMGWQPPDCGDGEGRDESSL